MSALETRTAPATSLQVSYDKRLMVFSGRANPELAQPEPTPRSRQSSTR